MGGQPTYEEFMERMSQNQAIDSKMRQATEYHKLGKLQNAKNIYKEVLKINPRHSDALHILGLIEHDKGESALAVDYITAAIKFVAASELGRSADL